MLSTVARRAAARRVPTFAPIMARGYAENAFGKKEKAHEDQYARKHEQEQLEKLRKSIAAKKAELEALEKEHAKKATETK